jgi:hypothetical protein
MRTQPQIDEQINKAMQSTAMTGMTYEEGVRAALEWVSDITEEEPMEE